LLSLRIHELLHVRGAQSGKTEMAKGGDDVGANVGPIAPPSLRSSTGLHDLRKPPLEELADADSFVEHWPALQES
jgi:hypothetical protein